MLHIPDGSIKLANPSIEPLPRGANFIRAKALWELALDIAGDPAIPYGGDRDVRISVGSGGGASWKPALNLATGSAIMAHDVAAGNVDVAFVNPSALLTQAYRGTGLFNRPLDLRVLWVYPSWDSFAMAIHPRHQVRCVRDIAERKIPLRLSVREDPTHSTLVLIDQLFGYDGFSIEDVLSWGGEIVPTGSPYGNSRMHGIADGTVDAVFDEALVAWFDFALEHGYQLLEFTPGSLDAMSDIGWRKMTIQPGQYQQLDRPYDCLDFSGWPLYCRADLDEKHVIDVCKAVVAREQQIPWTAGDYKEISQVFHECEEAPRDVPLHPGVEIFLKEHFHV